MECQTAPYPSGKGEVCKTFMHRFESGRRLFEIQFEPRQVPGLSSFVARRRAYLDAGRVHLLAFGSLSADRIRFGEGGGRRADLRAA